MLQMPSCCFCCPRLLGANKVIGSNRGDMDLELDIILRKEYSSLITIDQIYPIQKKKKKNL